MAMNEPCLFVFLDHLMFSFCYLQSREEPERYGDFKKAEKKYEKQRTSKVKDYGKKNISKLISLLSKRTSIQILHDGTPFL